MGYSDSGVPEFDYCSNQVDGPQWRPCIPSHLPPKPLTSVTEKPPHAHILNRKLIPSFTVINFPRLRLLFPLLYTIFRLLLLLLLFLLLLLLLLRHASNRTFENLKLFQRQLWEFFLEEKQDKRHAFPKSRCQAEET